MRTGRLSILVFALAVSAARADIAPPPEFGQSLTPNETKTLVAMTSEEVFITLHAEKATVRAVFHLRNTGPETKLEVGFPDVAQMATRTTGEPRVGFARWKLREFKATVDGAETAYRHRHIEKSKDPVPEAARMRYFIPSGWLVWDMSFEAGQKRTVEVTYWVPYRPGYGHTLLGDRHFQYVLRTGVLWHGPIGRARITVKLGEGVRRKQLEVVRPAGSVEADGEIRWDLREIEPTEDVHITVRKYLDFEDAARAHLAAAEKWPRQSHEYLASAAICQEESGQYEACVTTCRRIVEHEKAARVKQTGARISYRVLRWRKDFYEPWECRIVRCLVKLGRLDEARKEAPAALDALRLARAEADHYRYRDPQKIDERIARYEAFAKGGEFKD